MTSLSDHSHRILWVGLDPATPFPFETDVLRYLLIKFDENDDIVHCWKQEQGYGVRNQIDGIKWRDVLWLCLMMEPRVIKSRE